MRIQWWDWSLEKIEENIELFYQPELFCKTFDLVGHTYSPVELKRIAGTFPPTSSIAFLNISKSMNRSASGR